MQEFDLKYQQEMNAGIPKSDFELSIGNPIHFLNIINSNQIMLMKSKI